MGSTAWNLTTYQADIVSYISGFVVRSLKKMVSCPDCLVMLEANQSESQLQIRKTYGKLTSASIFVTKICKVSEQVLKEGKELQVFKNKRMTEKILNVIISKSICNLPNNIYQFFDSHMFEGDVIDGHAIQLIRLILKRCITIRIHHECKIISDLSGGGIRHHLTKSILFKNQ